MQQANTLITKERVKAWGACESGYRWFLENYKPAESEFVPVCQHLVKDKRGGDADWLMGKLFPEIDATLRVKLVTQIAGAEERLIAEQVATGAPGFTTEGEANAATTGNWANAATTGEGANAATTGEGAVAAALGRKSKAKASVGGAIVLVYRDEDWNLKHVRAAMVGQDGIKPDAWYSLNEAGDFIEVAEND